MSNAGNWQGGAAPNPAATTNDLQFLSGANTSPIPDGGTWIIHSITFENTAPAFTVTAANSITLGASGINSVINSGSNLQTISSAIKLSGGAQSWSANSGDLTFGGNINNAGFGLTLNGGHNFILNGILSGAGALTVSDAGGAVTLAGANTYTGGTTVTATTLNLNNAAALGTGTFTVNSTTTNLSTNLTVTNANSGANSFSNTVTLAGAAGARTVTNNGTGSLTFGAITGVHNLTVTGSGATSITGAITTGASTLTKSGSGTLTLSGANTYSGNTTINGGTLRVSGGIGDLGDNGSGVGSYAGAITIGNTDTLQYSSNANQTLSGIISGAGSVIKDTNGSTLILSNNNTYTGNTTVSVGKLQINGGGDLGDNNGGVGVGVGNYAGTITTSNTGTLEYDSTANQTLSGAISGAGVVTKDTSSTSILTLSGTNGFTGGLNLNAGTVKVTSNNNLGGAGNVLTFKGGTLEVATGLITAHTIQVAASSTGTLQIDPSQTLTLSSSVLTAIDLNSKLIVNGNTTGNLTFGADQNFIGNLDLSNTTLSLAGHTLTVGTLEISANSTIDFGSSASIISATNVIIDSGAKLTISNWVDEKSYFYAANFYFYNGSTDQLAPHNTTGGDPEVDVFFTGAYSDATGATTKWLSYTDGPLNQNEITPVPEPATYGALFTAATLGLFFWFRLKASAPRPALARVAVRY